jgi:hypothetical protein
MGDPIRCVKRSGVPNGLLFISQLAGQALLLERYSQLWERLRYDIFRSPIMDSSTLSKYGEGAKLSSMSIIGLKVPRRTRLSNLRNVVKFNGN